MWSNFFRAAAWRRRRRRFERAPSAVARDGGPGRHQNARTPAVSRSTTCFGARVSFATTASRPAPRCERHRRRRRRRRHRHRSIRRLRFRPRRHCPRSSFPRPVRLIGHRHRHEAQSRRDRAQLLSPRRLPPRPAPALQMVPRTAREASPDVTRTATVSAKNAAVRLPTAASAAASASLMSAAMMADLSLRR